MSDEKVPDSPDWAELMRMAFQSMMSGVHVALPGKIQTWDPIQQRANVKPLIKRVFYTFERDRQVEDLPVIPKVPVIFPRSSEMFVTFPLKKDDHVLLLFNERSIDQFMAKDKTDPDPATDPLDVRRFDLSDAVAIAGFYPDARKLVDVHPTNLVIGRDKGGMQLHITPTDVAQLKVGAVADVSVAIAESLQTFWDTVVKPKFDAADLHTHVAPAGGGTTSTPSVAVALPALDTAIISANLKLKDN